MNGTMKKTEGYVGVKPPLPDESIYDRQYYGGDECAQIKK